VCGAPPRGGGGVRVRVFCNARGRRCVMVADDIADMLKRRGAGGAGRPGNGMFRVGEVSEQKEARARPARQVMRLQRGTCYVARSFNVHDENAACHAVRGRSRVCIRPSINRPI